MESKQMGKVNKSKNIVNSNNHIFK